MGAAAKIGWQHLPEGTIGCRYPDLEESVSLEVRLEEIGEEELPPIEYRRDRDTEILTATLRSTGVSEGLSGSVDIQGPDGAWLMLEVSAGRLASVEVAVWPDVQSVESLTLPIAAGAARLRVPSRPSQPGLAAVEVEAAIRAVADRAEKTIHFRIGLQRPSRPLHVARDLIVEVDARSRISGLWLLNVPPFPAAT